MLKDNRIKRVRKTYKPKTERQKLIEKLDTICRKILRIRDSFDGVNYKCVSCGKIEPVEKSNVSHYISRRYLAVRWDLNNIHLSCVHCNKWLGGNIVEYWKALVVMLDVKEVERLETFGTAPADSEFDLQCKLKELEEVYRKLEEEENA